MSSEKYMPVKRLVWALGAAGVLGAAGGALAMHGASQATQPSGELAASVLAPAATAVASTLPAAVSPGVALPDFATLAAQQGPAVVNITVVGKARPVATQQGGAQMDPDDPFSQFFRRFGIPNMPGMPGMPSQGRAQPMHGEGSGFIIRADGLILTNAHVVRDASEVTVKLTDRREFRAKVLGSDPGTDVAVIKIEAKDLPVVHLGDSKNLRVGDWVLAIGSPYGFENSVTQGVVSAKGRALPSEDRTNYVPFIQTDVAVNPGNSGGPLFNTRGEVVGINSQIYSQTGGFQGLSFSIPIEVAEHVAEQIEKGGKVEHAKLGVSIQDVNQAFADSFKLARPEGALVANVQSGSPGAKAGLKSGDVILKFNNQPIVASADLPYLVGQAMPGETAKLDIWRNGKMETLTAKLGDASDKSNEQVADNESAAGGQLGLALRPLEPNERNGDLRSGLVIEDVGGAAARAGVQPGDVLLAVNGTPVNSVEQVRSVVAGSAKSVALLVQRGQQQIFLPVHLG